MRNLRSWLGARNGVGTMNGTIKDSLDLFAGLQSKGIPAHFWPELLECYNGGRGGVEYI